MRLAFVLVTVLAATSVAQDFAPIPTEELQLKDNPLRPGDAAMVLAREMHTDDTKSTETHYTRIKVFTEKGRSYADVTITYWKDEIRITDLKARTVQPDGRVVEFKGQPFDQVVVKSRRVRLSAKKFSLPDVQPGSIIEYRYTLRWNPRFLYPTFWRVQDELFVRRAKFSILPNTGTIFGFHGISYLPRGTQAVKEGAMYRLEVENVAPLEEEPFMPPAEHYSGRMIFFYSTAGLEDAEAFWMRNAKEWSEGAEEFIGKNKLKDELTRVQDAASPKEKLLRLYARAQGVRNLSFEARKTEQELKKLRDNKKAEDVLRNGYGYEVEIALAMVALARAAGFEAWPVHVSSRNEQVFNKEFQDTRQLDAWVVAIKVDGKPLFLDPGTPNCPFGLLSWEKTAATGLQLQKEGSVWLQTPVGPPSEATITRKGTFAIDANGDLSGTVDVVFSGQEALSRYLELDEKDAHGRTEYLEKEAQAWFPGSATAKLNTAPPQPSATEPLRASFSIQAAGFATVSGTRIILTSGVLNPVRGLAAAKTRKYPVHLPYAFEHTDDISLSLPPDHSVEQMPADRKHSPTFAFYQLTRSKDERAIRIQRTFRVAQPIIALEQYPVLRGFLTGVTIGNEEQVVLARGGAAASKSAE
jgi:hypothetical protein